VQVEECVDARAFLALAGPFLLQNEVEDGVLGIADIVVIS
jgi:hypothetical protein